MAPIVAVGEVSAVADVSVTDVRDVLHISEADIPDAQVLKMIKRASVTLALELSESIDYLSCSDSQKKP